MLTETLIKSRAPGARSDYVAALLAGEDTLAAYQINTPLRLAGFMATVCHETGGLTIVRENTGWTEKNLKIFSAKTAAKIRPFVGNKVKEANAAYGARMGNEENGLNDDDGWRYRGGGMIQLTGRNSYRAAGVAIGVNLESQPELIEDAGISLRAACWEFSKFVAFCDKGEKGFRSVCNGINRGNALSTLDPIGWADRQVWYANWLETLGLSAAPADDILNFGDQGALVRAVQERLAALGYTSGKADGVFGSRTRAAVLAFQAENRLTIDGEVGAETRAALNSSAAVPMPVGERATATVADLKAAGSETVASASMVKNGAIAMAVLSGGTGVSTTVTTPAAPDLISTTRDTITEVNSWKLITNAMSEAFMFATSHWWIFGVVAAFAFYRWGRKIELRRLLDHQLGLNLSR